MSTERASDRAYASLRAAIVDWELEPGTVLQEVEQAARLGVSRTPLREALSRLASDGLVEPLPGRGLVVSAFSLEDVAQLYELRAALETHAARLAAARHRAEPFQELEAAFTRVADVLDDDDEAHHGYYALVARFDAAIDEAVGNRFLVADLQSMRAHLARARRLSRRSQQRLTSAAAEHLAIVRAILDGDGELAANATHVHLSNALRSIRQTAPAAHASEHD
ncbi:transcriptional regulator, GntR family [Agrococcus baldri]|uniref:Transcriptional regulator, GntR family n=1 Tax=Agrococcus baldri TaxID=153730 RepID=A0AA94KYL9_9MICO|nr:GntR family transcriptional regulator [Agrococcus baldri]SFR99716.1 transcriptional regulator, GntR family [Agrococcus baldri]